MITVGIVIPTCDRPYQLYQAVKSLRENIHNHNLFDLCIVDDGQVSFVDLDRINSIWPSVKFFKTGHNGPAYSRNIGVNNVEGEWLAFIDDDCKITGGWCNTILSIIKDSPNSLVAIGGDVLPSKPDSIISWYLSSTDHLRGPLKYKGEIVGLAGANILIRRNAFMLVNGFEENLISRAGSEDTNLIYKLNKIGVCEYNPGFSIEHNNSITLVSFCKKYINYGYSLAAHVVMANVSFRDFGVYVLPPIKNSAVLFSIYYVFALSARRLLKTPYRNRLIAWNLLFWPLSMLQELCFQYGALRCIYLYLNSKVSNIIVE